MHLVHLVQGVFRMRLPVLSLGLIAVFALPAMAQPVQTAPPSPGVVVTGPPGLPSHQPLVNHPTNLGPGTTHSVISPALPSVGLGPNATAADYLQAAQNALATNRLGLAQEALENAQTLLLTRSVPMAGAAQPDSNPAVHNISQALQALGAHDVGTAASLVEQTIPMAQQMSASSGTPMPPPGQPVIR